MLFSPYVNSLLLCHKMNLIGAISLQEAILIAICARNGYFKRLTRVCQIKLNWVVLSILTKTNQ